jgi:hypothetical protein
MSVLESEPKLKTFLDLLVGPTEVKTHFVDVLYRGGNYVSLGACCIFQFATPQQL